jgi:L-ribulose-5-phosphate 3-epimerase
VPMQALNRRNFLEVATVTAIATAIKPLAASQSSNNDSRMRLGMIVHVGQDPEAALQKVHELGLPTAQVGVEDFSDAMFSRLTEAVEKFGIEVTALNTAGPGPAVWDFYQGPETIGLVPRKYRAARVEHMKRASDFAKRAGFPAIHTHFGFIPENPNDPLYSEVVKAIHEVVAHIKSNGQFVLYETGQESPITLLRCITDVGLDNQFVNLDTANLILYGKGNPVDALDVVGKLVRGMHAKDGLFPTNPKELGEEVPIGHGRVDFPTLFKRLKELHYRGPVTIEREISGPQQLEDVRKEKLYLEKLIA